MTYSKTKSALISALVMIFLGSVFLTSEKFVDSTNTPKLYFVVVCVLLSLAFATVFKKRIAIGLFNKKLLWGIHVVCTAQAVYGLLQFMWFFPSNHSKFAITGSFDNPAGFAAVLSIGFPIGLYLLIKSQKVQRCLAGAGTALIVATVLLSGSRAGMLSILLSSIVLVFLQTRIKSILKRYIYYRLGYLILLSVLIVGAYVLYHQKKESANGRLLIWKVSSDLIKDKPILGHGYGAFQAKYMDYQAEYFRNNPDSEFAMLADNVKHPFNEFIKVGVEFGIIGLVMALTIILLVLWKAIEMAREGKGSVLSGLLSFLVFANFSYPLQYVGVWVLLAFYLSELLPLQEIVIKKNTPISIFVRSFVFLVCVFVSYITYIQICAEIRWKTIATESLKGNTEEMLPEYNKLYSTPLDQNPYFLYNYGAELNFSKRFDKSIDILTKCKEQFNDYDLQMLMADNYYQIGDGEKAIATYQHAANMIPCRFLPLFKQLEIYQRLNQNDVAFEFAKKIINKEVKIPSVTVHSIIFNAQEFISHYKQ